jgi:hypothetical protein
MNSKLSAEERIARNREIARQYRAGQVTSVIAEQWNLTCGRVVQILNSQGVSMRLARGGGRAQPITGLDAP